MKVVLFDTPAEDAQAAVDFWSQALGHDSPEQIGTNRPYVRVGELHNAADMFVQRIDSPPRIHIDIETDNVDAEVSRLEALGAVRREKVESWWVMEAPSGHIFCVVPIQSKDFPDGAKNWE